MSDILVFKIDHRVARLKDTPLKTDISIKIWKPTLRRIIPPLHGYLYLLRLMAQYLGIFKNGEYSAVVAYHGGEPIGAVVIIPKFFRWKFMKKEDVHFTSVVLKPGYRGAGIAYHMMKYGVEKFSSSHRALWIIARDDNLPALKLYKKVGFKYHAKALRTNRLGLRCLGEVVLLPDD